MNERLVDIYNRHLRMHQALRTDGAPTGDLGRAMDLALHLAVNDVPWLIARIEQLEKEIREYEELIARMTPKR